jgi:hypothetical protein
MAADWQYKITDNDLISAWKKTPSATAIAKQFGMNSRAVSRRLSKLRSTGLKLCSPIPRSPYFDPGMRVGLSETIAHARARINVKIGTGVILVGSDPHWWPNEITTATRAFVKFSAQVQPDIIIMNGDIFDGASISRWPRIGWDKVPTVKEELDACRDRLGEIEKAAPKAKKYWPLGNHCARFENRVAQLVPEYQGVHGFSLKDHFPLWTPCWAVKINDELLIKHRYKSGMYHARNDTLNAGISTCVGHLHDQNIMRISDENGTRWGVDGGTLADPLGPQFVNYTESNTKSWKSGFVLITFVNGRMLRPELIEVYDEDEGIVDFRGELIEV